jgi:hypothetical protein
MRLDPCTGCQTARSQWHIRRVGVLWQCAAHSQRQNDEHQLSAFVFEHRHVPLHLSTCTPTPIPPFVCPPSIILLRHVSGRARTCVRQLYMILSHTAFKSPFCPKPSAGSARLVVPAPIRRQVYMYMRILSMDNLSHNKKTCG